MSDGSEVSRPFVRDIHSNPHQVSEIRTNTFHSFEADFSLASDNNILRTRRGSSLQAPSYLDLKARGTYQSLDTSTNSNLLRFEDRPPRSSSLAQFRAPSQTNSLPPSPHQNQSTTYSELGTRTPFNRTNRPSNLDNGQSLEVVGAEIYETELQSIHYRGDYTATVEAVKRQAQHDIEAAKQRSLSIIDANGKLESELIHLRKKMSELEHQAQRDNERHSAELATTKSCIVDLKETLQSSQDLKERLGIAEQEISRQRDIILGGQELESKLKEANSLLSAQTDACNQLEVRLRGYKSQIKRYNNFWRNSIHKSEVEKSNLDQRIAFLERYITTLHHHQVQQSQTVQREFLQKDKELIRFQKELRTNLRSEIEVVRRRGSDLQQNVEVAERARNELQDQQDGVEDDDHITLDNKLAKLYADLNRLYKEQNEVHGVTRELQRHEQQMSDKITILEKNVRNSTKQIQQPCETNTTEFSISWKDLHRLQRAISAAQLQSISSLPELVQDADSEEIDEDELSECHTPGHLDQKYILYGEMVRNSIASHISAKQKRFSSYDSPPKDFI